MYLVTVYHTTTSMPFVTKPYSKNLKFILLITIDNNQKISSLLAAAPVHFCLPPPSPGRPVWLLACPRQHGKNARRVTHVDRPLKQLGTYAKGLSAHLH